MASTINGTSTGNGGLISTGDDSGILNIQTNDTTAITVDASQNVGIGTTSPAVTLDARSASAAAARFSRSGTSGQLTSVVFEDGSGTLGSASTTRIASSTGYMAFSTGGTSGDTAGGSERMRIDSSGRLLLNQTSNNGTYLMQMIQQSSTSGAMLIQIATNGNNGVSFLNAGGAAQVGTIVVNSGSTAYNTSSDYRLKENIAPMTGALAKVAQLKPVTYKWKADGSDGQGFVAHELAEIVPDCVSGEKDAVDEDGKPVYQGIDVSFLVATLTAAIQEQQALITAQAETINALTARIVAIESRGTV